MAGNSVGNVSAGLTLDPSGFTQGINKAINDLTRFVKQAGDVGRKAGSTLGADLQKAVTRGFVTGQNPFKEMTSLMEKEVLRLSDKLSLWIQIIIKGIMYYTTFNLFATKL